jgi:phosphate transport system substrate-binding protein
MGGVVPIVNLPGVQADKIKLTGETLAKIYLGEITKWDDAALKADNPDLALPNTDIAAVVRADGSGTTWIFTNYLSKVSPTFKEKVGSSTMVKWPAAQLAGKGNPGVANYVKQTQGAIGYVEYTYAKQTQQPFAQLKNKEGKFVAATSAAFQAAAANADWKNAPGFYMVLTEQPGAESWPITGASFILMHAQQADAAHAKEVLKFFGWCYSKGGAAATELHYVPMPDAVVGLVKENAWTQIK